MKLDLRYLQILFLTSFLGYGLIYLSWDVKLENIACLFFIALLTQTMFCLAFKIPVNAIKSTLITALGLSIILRSNHIFIYGLAGFFAISSKYIFRYNSKHFFNPANFGLVFIILFTGSAWISVGQWGNSASILFIAGSLGLLILTNLRKIDLAFSFIFFFFGLIFCWNIIYKGWPLDHFIHDISSGSVVLFTFFMITDPSSTPNTRVARVIWVFLISILAFYLQVFMFVKGAPIYALFIMSLLTPLFDYIFKNESKFSWDSMYQRELFTNDQEYLKSLA